MTNKVTNALKHAIIMLSKVRRYFMNFGRENEQLEFKKSTSEVKEAMNDICAMAMSQNLDIMICLHMLVLGGE